MNIALKNYKAGALWKTREDLWVNTEKSFEKIKIKKNSIVFIIKIVEDLQVTHIKLLYNNKIYYCFNIDLVSLSFIYDESKIIK